MKVLMIPTARATFAVDVANERAAQARGLLRELGAEVTGPAELVMTDEDVSNAERFLSEDYDLIIHVHASFCDAGPAPSAVPGHRTALDHMVVPRTRPSR